MRYLIIILFLFTPFLASATDSAVLYDWSLGVPTMTASSTVQSYFDWSHGQSIVSATTTVPAETAPVVDRVRNWPNNQSPGFTVTFVVDWHDANEEGVKMLICKTDAITVGASPSCDGGEWASDKDTYDTANPLEATHVTTGSDVGNNLYYAFVCDNEPTCSSSESGSFDVLGVETQAATNVDSLTATINGELFDLIGGAPLDLSFEWGETVTDNFIYADNGQATSSLGKFSVQVNDLKPSTLYYFRANAFDTLGATTTATSLSFTTQTFDPVTTATTTSIADTTATFNAVLDDLGGTTTLQSMFEYGIDETFTATTSGQGITSTGAFSEGITGLTTFEEYAVRGVAITATQYFLDTVYTQFFTADISTSTPVVEADLHAWDLSDFSHGSTTNSTGTTVLILEAPGGGGGVATTSATFETGNDNWNLTVAGDDGDWTRDSGGTPSSGTGPCNGGSGSACGAEGSDFYLFTETSGSTNCANPNKDCHLEFDIEDNTDSIAIDFWYHALGVNLGSLYLDKYNGSTWDNLWSDTDHGSSNTWFNVYIENSDGDAQKIRFRAPVDNSSWSADIAVDSIDVATSTAAAFVDGAWTSPPWTITGVDSVDDSYIEYASTTPSDTDVRVKVAVNSDAGTQPAEGDFTEIASGSNMSAGGVTGDLTGKFVWVRIELDASTDGLSTPTVTQFIMGINDGEAVGEPTEIADHDYQGVNFGW